MTKDTEDRTVIISRDEKMKAKQLKEKHDEKLEEEAEKNREYNEETHEQLEEERLEGNRHEEKQRNVRKSPLKR